MWRTFLLTGAAVLLLANGQPVPMRRSPHAEMEARRRSAVDKVFLRFGRSPYHAIPSNLKFNDVDRIFRAGRSGKDNFIRFRKGSPLEEENTEGQLPNVMRFEQDPSLDNSAAERERRFLPNFIRFRKDSSDIESPPDEQIRFNEISPQDEELTEDQPSNSEDMIRQGRSQNFLRFGKSLNSEKAFYPYRPSNGGPQKIMFIGKKKGRDNYIRFRRRDDNFLRYGRSNDQIPETGFEINGELMLTHRLDGHDTNNSADDAINKFNTNVLAER